MKITAFRNVARLRLLETDRRSSKTSVSFYESTRRNIPEDRTPPDVKETVAMKMEVIQPRRESIHPSICPMALQPKSGLGLLL
jgi:hypothetical protein